MMTTHPSSLKLVVLRMTAATACVYSHCPSVLQHFLLASFRFPVWAEMLALSNSVLLSVRWVALGGLSQVNIQLLSSSRKVRPSQTAGALPPASQQLLMLSPSADQVLPNAQRLHFVCFTYFTHADRRCEVAAWALAGLQSGADTREQSSQLKVQLVASFVISACPQGITMKNRHCFVVAILFLMAIVGSIARPV